MLRATAERSWREMVHHMDGRAVDALACGADEGRGDAARCPGERLPRGDPGVPEWSNPGGVMPADRRLNV